MPIMNTEIIRIDFGTDARGENWTLEHLVLDSLDASRDFADGHSHDERVRDGGPGW